MLLCALNVLEQVLLPDIDELSSARQDGAPFAKTVDFPRTRYRPSLNLKLAEPEVE